MNETKVTCRITNLVPIPVTIAGVPLYPNMSMDITMSKDQCERFEKIPQLRIVDVDYNSEAKNIAGQEITVVYGNQANTRLLQDIKDSINAQFTDKQMLNLVTQIKQLVANLGSSTSSEGDIVLSNDNIISVLMNIRDLAINQAQDYSIQEVKTVLNNLLTATNNLDTDVKVLSKDTTLQILLTKLDALTRDETVTALNNLVGTLPKAVTVGQILTKLNDTTTNDQLSSVIAILQRGLGQDATLDDILANLNSSTTSNSVAVIETIVSTIADLLEGSNKEETQLLIKSSLENVAKDSTVSALTNYLTPLAKDDTVKDVKTALASVAKDNSLQAIVSAFGPLATEATLLFIRNTLNTLNSNIARDASLQDIKGLLVNKATEATLKTISDSITLIAKDTTLQSLASFLQGNAKDSTVQAIVTALTDKASETTLNSIKTNTTASSKEVTQLAVLDLLKTLGKDTSLKLISEALTNKATESSQQAIVAALGPLAKDSTMQAFITSRVGASTEETSKQIAANTLGVAKDTTLQSLATFLQGNSREVTLQAILAALTGVSKDSSLQNLQASIGTKNNVNDPSILTLLTTLAKDTTVQAVVSALSDKAKDTTIASITTALSTKANDSSVQAVNSSLNGVAKDSSLQSLITQGGLLAKDTSIQALLASLGSKVNTNDPTVLALLGLINTALTGVSKDASVQAITAALSNKATDSSLQAVKTSNDTGNNLLTTLNSVIGTISDPALSNDTDNGSLIAKVGRLITSNATSNNLLSNIRDSSFSANAPPVKGNRTFSGTGKLTLNVANLGNAILHFEGSGVMTFTVTGTADDDSVGPGGRLLFKAGIGSLGTNTLIVNGVINSEYRIALGGQYLTIECTSYTSGSVAVNLFADKQTPLIFINGPVHTAEEEALRSGRLFVASAGFQQVATNNYLNVVFSNPANSGKMAYVIGRRFGSTANGSYGGIMNPTLATFPASGPTTINVNNSRSGGPASVMNVRYNISTTRIDSSPSNPTPTGGLLVAFLETIVTFKRAIPPGQTFGNFIGGAGGGLAAMATCTMSYNFYEEDIF